MRQTVIASARGKASKQAILQPGSHHPSHPASAAICKPTLTTNNCHYSPRHTTRSHRWHSSITACDTTLTPFTDLTLRPPVRLQTSSSSVSRTPPPPHCRYYHQLRSACTHCTSTRPFNVIAAHYDYFDDLASFFTKTREAIFASS